MSDYAPLYMIAGLLLWGFSFSAGSYILDALRRRYGHRKD
jgi:hypothetical protein